MKKRILALVLALAMVFALAACGGGGEQGGSTGTPAPETNTGTPSTDAPETSGGGAPTELKVAMTTTMGDMGPFTYSSAGRNNLRYFVYEYLAMFKEFGTPWNEMEWVIAKDIQQIDDVTYQIEIYDYVVDAIDTVSGKLALVEEAYQKGIPIISSMGAGNKLDPTCFQVADLFDTSVCPLCRVMRREVRRRNIPHLKVVYSTEPAISPSLSPETAPSSPGKRQVPGSVAFVPSVAGLILAGEVVKDLCSL